MSKILETIKCNRQHYYKVLMQNISEYIYREERYKNSFSIVTVCNKEDTDIDIDILKEELRKTDKLIPINEELFCVVFDNTSHESYVKAAENLSKTLQKIYYKKNFYLSTASSQEFDKNYLNMTNKLFERLEFAINNHQCNNVVYQDYII